MASPIHSHKTEIGEDVPQRRETVDIEMRPISREEPISTPPPVQDEQAGQSNNIRINTPLGSVHEQIQTVWSPYKNRVRFLACCLMGFGNGANDSAAGALIASIERHYAIHYGTVSIIFLCNAAGCLVTALILSFLTEKLGRAKTLGIAEFLLILGYISIILEPPFPVLCVSFFVLGIGMAMLRTMGQVFCSNLANNTTLLGIFQGTYGIGGISGPLIATSMLSHNLSWSRFYIILLCLAALNLVFSSWAFWDVEHDMDSRYAASTPQVTEPFRVVCRQRIQSVKALLWNRPTILGSAFVFAYQGAEVAISGWIISFLVQFRHGDPSKVGYVTSGFWAGIAFGRFFLSFLAHRIGERLFVFIVTIGALALEILIWFVPSIPSDSVAVSLSGLLLGPIYPCTMHVFHKLLPRKTQISSLSFIGSVGSSGGALAPFITGMLAQSKGTYVLHPICIGLFVGMCGAWWCLPKVERRVE